MGGGNAMPKAVLAGLKNNPEISISVISAMLDSGGTAGKERKIYKTNISFGDIRRSFLALSGSSYDILDAFNTRFEGGDYDGIVIANILGTAIAHKTNDYEKAFRVYNELLKIPDRHKVLPVTLDNSTVCAILENGENIEGETNIDIPKHDSNLKISNVFLRPPAKAYPKALESIKEADMIIIGPGDLYSSLAQILLVEGISDAVNKSLAPKVYICNLMTKKGETNNFTVINFSEEIEKYLKGKLNYIIYNNNLPSPDRIKNYRLEHPELLSPVILGETLDKRKFIGDDLIVSSGTIIHDSNKLTKIILNLCK